MSMTRPKIKICGITTVNQAKQIAAMEVNALGFILYKKSPRYIAPTKVKEILQRLSPLIKSVGVFVDEPIEKISNIYQTSGLDTVQLSGGETPEYCQELSQRGVSWIKSFRIKNDVDEEELERYGREYILLDAWSADEFGGTGKTFDWKLIENLQQKFKIILAGGINPNNVAKAVRLLEPYAIDVSSGVETSPGVKSLDKIEQLITRVNELY
jgi:phosphoribosylanthranilate isomerase